MKKIISQIIPLPRKDIDTDLIIPAEFLTVTNKKGLGKHLFSRLRSEKNFPLTLEKYKGAKILVVKDNFGCGSSREHAAWAIKDYGIDVVIAPSFADIFYNNALKNGILPVKLSANIVQKMFKMTEGDCEVDLEKQIVVLSNGEKISFEIDPYRKECLIHEMDDLDYLLSSLSDIKKFDKKHSKNIFFDTTKL